MGQKVLILGESGTGKSASLRNFNQDEVMVINVAGKPLPFKNHFEQVTPKYTTLTQDILNGMDTDKKVIIIDDAQYIMSFQYMRRINENGWDKWNDIQGDFFNIIRFVDSMPDDTIVYFLSHLQRTDDGHEKIKTMGKMLDEKITIEGLFTIVLKTAVKDGQYMFLTQNSGLDTVKSPIGMFDSYAIDNDLKYVDTKIRNYYEIGDYIPDEVVKDLDQAMAKADVQKPDADGRTRRRSKVAEMDKGTGAIVGATPEEQKAEEFVEEPKQRRRKERNVKNEEEKPEEAPAEEKKEETASEASGGERENRRNERRPAGDRNSDTTGNEVSAEAAGGRRRRRKANTITEDDFMNMPTDVPDDEVPFN